MRRNAWRRLGSLVIFVLAGLVAADEYLHVGWGTRAAVAIAGLLAFAGGIRVILTGEAVMGRQQVSNPASVSRFRGTSALLIGIALVLAGPALTGMATMSLFTGRDVSDVVGVLADSSLGMAVVLGAAGLAAVGFGAVRLRSGTGAPGYYDEVPEMSFRVSGAVTIGVGLVLLAAAGLLVFAPGVLELGVQRIAAPFGG